MRNAFLLCALIGASPAIAQTAPAPAPAAPAAGAAPATAAPAATAQITAGTAIVDGTGAPVGTVDQVAGDVVTVDTGTNKVGVPRGNFAAGPNGLILGNTKAQLDAAAGQAAAQAKAQVKTLLVAGAAVHGTGGMTLGTVKASDDEFVTVTSKQGDVRMPVSGFAAGPNGLVVGMTSAEFDAAVTAAKGK
jgi:hypothetical protein